MEADIQGQMMDLLRKRLEPFNVPNDVVRGIRDDIVKLTLPAKKKPFGAAVMTKEASEAGDQIKRGSDVAPASAKPKIV